MMIVFFCNKVTKLHTGFIKYLLKWLKHEIYRSANIRAIQVRLNLLPYANWISWKGKPHQIDANVFVQSVLNCFFWRYSKGQLIIKFDTHRIFPGTNNTVYQIMRFINYGNDAMSGTYFVSNIVNKYQKSIYDYFFAYRLRMQK